MTICNIDFESRENIKWVIDSKDTNNIILPTLLENVEFSGNFEMTPSKEKECHENTCQLKDVVMSSLYELNKGSSSSVKTSNGYCNFHTHPFSCYESEGTMWGWPSGEDMRESIRFSLKGNLFHMVFTLEGIYCIQVNPNLIALLMNDEKLKTNKCSANQIRGMLACLIESYFKATHGHRTIKYSHDHGKTPNLRNGCKTSDTWGVCTPQDWVDFVNKFKLSNLVSEDKQCSRLLPCHGFPEFDKKKTGTINLSEYLDVYGIDTFDIDKKGVTLNTKTTVKTVLANFEYLLDLFSNIPTDLKYNQESWDKSKIFNCELIYNCFKCDNKFVNFEKWMKFCVDKSKRCPKILSRCIHSYWQKFKTDTTIIKFNNVNVMFKPFTDKNCTLVHNTAIPKWIENKFSTKKTKTKIKKLTKTNNKQKRNKNSKRK